MHFAGFDLQVCFYVLCIVGYVYIYGSYFLALSSMWAGSSSTEYAWWAESFGWTRNFHF